MKPQPHLAIVTAPFLIALFLCSYRAPAADTTSLRSSSYSCTNIFASGRTTIYQENACRPDVGQSTTRTTILYEPAWVAAYGFSKHIRDTAFTPVLVNGVLTGWIIMQQDLYEGPRPPANVPWHVVTSEIPPTARNELGFREDYEVDHIRVRRGTCTYDVSAATHSAVQWTVHDERDGNPFVLVTDEMWPGTSTITLTSPSGWLLVNGATWVPLLQD